MHYFSGNFTANAYHPAEHIGISTPLWPVSRPWHFCCGRSPDRATAPTEGLQKARRQDRWETCGHIRGAVRRPATTNGETFGRGYGAVPPSSEATADTQETGHNDGWYIPRRFAPPPSKGDFRDIPRRFAPRRAVDRRPRVALRTTTS